MGALIAAMILPFSMMTNATAEVETANEDRFAKFLELAAKQDRLSEKIEMFKDDSEHDHFEKIQKIEERIENIQNKMDRLQQKEYDAVTITPEELGELKKQGKAILADVSNPNSVNYVSADLLDYFIDESSKKVSILAFGAESPNLVDADQQAFTQNSVSPYDIQYVKQNSHTVVCNDREADCAYSIGGIGIQAGSNQFTLGFSAKQDGDRGFVTVAHGVGSVGSDVKQYNSRVVGEVKDFDNASNCYCAFVKVTKLSSYNCLQSPRL